MGLSGLLLVNKPSGPTSHDVVDRARRALKQRDVGHTGTLDPMATGLMILVLGEATKLSNYLTFSDKVYSLRAKLGVRTDSLDATGEILSQVAVDLPQETIRAKAMELQGDFDWPVPIFSAAKVAGRKLYEYGRSQEDVEVPIKRMSFSDLQIDEVTRDSVSLSFRCSKGSFVRSWCAELGERLGVGGHLESLCRKTVGSYSLEQAISLEELEAGEMRSAFVSLRETLPDWRSVRVVTKEERLLQNGQIPRDLANRLIVEQKEALRRGEPVGVKVFNSSGELLSLLIAQPGQGLKIGRVFRLDPSKVSQ